MQCRAGEARRQRQRAALKPGQMGDAVRFDAAQVGGDEHVNANARIVPRHTQGDKGVLYQSLRCSDREANLLTCGSHTVVEHLRDPIAALSKMVNWLSPEGLVYIEVPDMGKVNPSKGFGGLHFAHVLGFNHHNLVLAALKVGLRPKVAVSPTGIVFERGVGEDADQIASRGRELSQEIYGNGCAYRSYVNYQFGKLMNRWPSQDVA